MNRFFIAFAVIVSSGIFGFSYFYEWLQYALFHQEPVLNANDSIDYPYFHSSKQTYLAVMLVFGILFLTQFILGIYYSICKNHKAVFMVFVSTMLTILAVMINSAIK